MDNDDDIEIIEETDQQQIVNPVSSVNGTGEFEVNPDVVDLSSDSDESDIILEKVQNLNDDEELELKLERIDKILSWFVKMKPELIIDCEITRDDYLKSSVRDELAVDLETSKKCLEEYRNTGEYEHIHEKLGLGSPELTVVAICIAVLDEDNSSDIDFTGLCFDRLDSFTFNTIKTCMSNSTIGVDESSRFGPLMLMRHTLMPPANVVLGLTIMWLRVNQFPIRVEWIEMERKAITQNDVAEFQKNVVEAALDYFARNNTVESECRKFDQELDDFQRDYQLTTQSVRQSIERAKAAMSEIRKPAMSELMAEIRENPTTPVELTSLECRRNLEAMREMKRELATHQEIYNRRMETMLANSPSLQDALLFKYDDFCLARSVADEAAPFEIAVVQEQVNMCHYRVRFAENGETKLVHIANMAHPRFTMFDAVVAQTMYIGLRVVCRVVDVGGGGGGDATDAKWMAGTIGGHAMIHGDEFLVFFDDGQDRYVRAPTHPTSVEAMAIGRLAAVSRDRALLRRRLELVKIVPMVEQSFNEKKELDRFHVHELIREKTRAKFLMHYLARYPEWPLLRVSVGEKLQIFKSDNSRNKVTVTVVHVDRAFCVVRYTFGGSVLGQTCLQYPCAGFHPHTDEKLYRGSYRIPDVVIDQSGENNLSRRVVQRLRRLFDPSQSTPKMPVLGVPTCDGNDGVGGGDDDDVDDDVVVTRENLKARRRKRNELTSNEIVERRRKQNIINRTIVRAPQLQPLSELKFHELCGPDCLQGMDADPYDSRFHRCSPLHVPILCGWRRYKFTMKVFKRRANTRKCIIYYGPCGKPLAGCKEITNYLRETQSMITIDCFSFDLDVDTETYITVDEKYLKTEDYANGIEGIPIPAVNTVDDENPPVIDYTKRRYQYDDTVDLQTINRDFCSGCSCEGDCSDASKCECLRLSISSYNALPNDLRSQNKKFQGLYDYRMLSEKVYSGIYECNDQCSCHRKNCHNRVVQNNIKYPIQLYKTAESGWGIRALTDIPHGAFICNYVGAILTNELADQHQNDDQYFADLDLKDVVEREKMMDENSDDDLGFDEDESRQSPANVDDADEDDDDLGIEGSINSEEEEEEDVAARRSSRQVEKQKAAIAEQQRKKEEREERKRRRNQAIFKWDDYFGDLALFVLDAKRRGNIGRFLNHSCDPNVVTQHVLYDTHDLRLPWTAFFARRFIKAGEELCWDYNYTMMRDNDEQIVCNCGSERCRGRLL
ncbi:unnamed protein product [Caenorhabditis bovis]|uniref:Uncharacterized protein n=1 Tax=Caenorhabditis bovis TaxID=2654633 RepID=A0A8S1EQM2_9PELO|nr:unnamed protein product [Caenorhabditis bovis]